MQTLTLRDRVKLQRFTRGLGPEAGPVQLDRSRIFILPTATGLLFAGVLLIMLFGSITYNNRDHLLNLQPTVAEVFNECAAIRNRERW